MNTRNKKMGDNAWIKLIVAFVFALIVCTALTSCGDGTISDQLPESQSEYDKIVNNWFFSSSREFVVSPGTIVKAKPINSDSDKFAKKLPLRIENKSDKRWLSDCRPINDIPDNFSFSASAMLAKELDPKFKDSINSIKKSNESRDDKNKRIIPGFGIYLKYENDKKPSFTLNLLEYDNDAKIERVYDFAIRVLFSRVTFDVGSVSAVGYLREGNQDFTSKDGFGVFGNKTNSKCVGFFVDPSLDVAFYGFEIKGSKIDGQVSAINENIRIAYDKINSLEKENGQLKAQINAESKSRASEDTKIKLTLDGDKNNDGLVKRIGKIETKNKEITGESGSVKISVGSDTIQTSLTNIHLVLREIVNLDQSTLKSKLDSSYEKKKS